MKHELKDHQVKWNAKIHSLQSGGLSQVVPALILVGSHVGSKLSTLEQLLGHLDMEVITILPLSDHLPEKDKD